MRLLFAALALGSLVSAAPASAQSTLDHQVQRVWDNMFDPPPPGDPRTNWERRADQHRANDAAAWCYHHPGAPNCYRR